MLKLTPLLTPLTISTEVFPRDLRKKEKFIKHLTGKLL